MKPANTRRHRATPGLIRIGPCLAAMTLSVVASAATAPAPGAGAGDDLAITHVDVYPAPGAARLGDTTIVIRAGRIAALGSDLDLDGVPVLHGGGRVATAGLWNAHVHFTDPAFAEDPQPIMRDMLLSRGFTSVVDTGSDPNATLTLAAAIEAGTLDGPRIVLASGSFVYRDGTPAYLPGIRLPELVSAAQAEPAVNAVLDMGAHGIKIFSGSFMAPGKTVLLPTDIIAAVSRAAHARNRFVVAHPTSRAGLENAVRGGVDVLAHTAPPAGPLGEPLIARMLAADVALVPTLKLWFWELGRHGVPPGQARAHQAAGVAQLAEYAAAGGEILFGTDVGYMSDYDTREEFEMMQHAGMDFAAILTALTTAPATRFAGQPGRLEAGAAGDVVLYARDPAEDPTAFAEVDYTIRNGRVVHAAPRIPVD